MSERKMVGVTKVPSWWRKIVRAHNIFKEEDPNYYPYAKEEFYTKQNNLPCADHISYDKEGKYIYFEPYGKDMKSMKELISFCENNKLDFVVGAESTWFPGSTLLIQISRKGDQHV